MKLKITPLFISSIGVIIFGLFYIFYKWDSNLGPLAGLLLMCCGVLCLGVYFVLRIVFRPRFWLQLICEIVLIVFVSFSSYKMSRKVILHIPAGFRGNIVLIYGVANSPKLKPVSFFERNIHIRVPQSGIVTMFNKFAEKYLNNLLVIDSLHSRVFEPGKYIGYGIDTLKCSGKPYTIEVLDYNYPYTILRPLTDTTEITRKKDRACKMLGQ
ncbi:MAG: hypothetical protein ABIN91_22200 [Mucilaginibacter sp.]|uniref:hypothetical protein n=1 Tax=Mucilaginibacter sp. TaxID=1882438 RepID=UPI003266C46F